MVQEAAGPATTSRAREPASPRSKPSSRPKERFAEAAPPDDQPPKLNFAAFVGYYFLLFAAHWCGSARFNKAQHPEDDFDPENLHHFLQNRRGHKDDKAMLEGNFRRVDHKALRRVEALRNERAGMKKQARQTQEAEPEFDGVTGAFASYVDGEAEEDLMYDNLFIKHIPPYCITVECIFVFLLWLIGATLLYSDPGSEDTVPTWTSRKGGLDTLGLFGTGESDLRWSNSECENLRFQVWRWFTYQYTHVGIWHVGFNIFLTVVMGIPLEGAHGSLRMFLMFNAGVLGGALAWFVLDGHGAVVGCSGGCYALIGVHFADLLMNWDSKKFKYPTLCLLVFLAVVDFINVVLFPSEGTSHVTHIGGSCAGLVIGVLLCKNLSAKCYERIIEVQLGIIGAGLLIFALVWLGIQDDGPKNILQTTPGWCSAFVYRDIPPGADQPPQLMCSYCGTEDCLAALRHRYKDCCAVGQLDCVSEPYYCLSPTAVDEEFCTENKAVWLALT